MPGGGTGCEKRASSRLQAPRASTIFFQEAMPVWTGARALPIMMEAAIMHPAVDSPLSVSQAPVP